jgi:hypothetical protein
MAGKEAEQVVGDFDIVGLDGAGPVERLDLKAVGEGWTSLASSTRPAFAAKCTDAQLVKGVATLGLASRMLAIMTGEGGRRRSLDNDERDPDGTRRLGQAGHFSGRHLRPAQVAKPIRAPCARK